MTEQRKKKIELEELPGIRDDLFFAFAGEAQEVTACEIEIGVCGAASWTWKICFFSLLSRMFEFRPIYDARGLF